MPLPSTFGPLDGSAAGNSAGFRAEIFAALDGVCYAIPVSLGCITIVFSHVGIDAMASGIFATMLALIVVHLVTARAGRPLLYSARVFEAAALAAMLDQVIVSLPAWGMSDSTGVRLAFLCLIGMFAGLTGGVLHLMRAHRLTAMIPAPVLAGFSNSIAVALVVSQTRILYKLITTAESVFVVVSIAVASFATMYALRRWRPKWPSAASGLVVGLALGLLWLAGQHPTPTVSTTGWSWTLPVFMADFGSLIAPDAHLWPMTLAIVGNGAILGIMVFINTTMTGQVLTQFDGRRPADADALPRTIALFAGGVAGAGPIAGSPASSMAAARTNINPAVMRWTALLMALIYLSGSLAWIPLAAVSSVMLCEAWFMVDRESVRLLRDWVLRRPLHANALEDLGLISAVTIAAVLVNMVAALFVGLMLGLLLFGLRNARQPVRYVWSGGQLSSNCARSRADIRTLSEHSRNTKIFELEGDLSFAAVDRMEQSLITASTGASCVVFDWSRVRHIDSSVAQMIAKFERNASARNLLTVHAGADMQTGNVGPELLRRLPLARFTPDLDYALEVAENHIIQVHARHEPQDATSVLEAASLFEGLAPVEREQLQSVMPHKFFPAGEAMLVAGDPSDELMLVLHGSASVIVRSGDGKDVRVAGIRRGAMIGEVGFLDRSTRSATVLAHEDTTVAILSRASYQDLCIAAPKAVERLLANIALGLAVRLRRANQLSALRNSQR